MSDNNTPFNLDNLLDGTLDDLANLPEFKAFPAGTHRVNISLVDKTAKKDWINGHPGYEAKLKMIETLEISNDGDTIPEAGAETQVLYLLDNEIGQGQFKNLLIAVSQVLDKASPREMAAQIQNMEAIIVTKKRSNKDKTQEYTQIVEITFET